MGEMNDSAFSNLVIGRRVFQRKRIHKATCVSPALSTENQSDDVFMGREFRRSLQDVCVKREADVAQTTIS